MATIIETKHGFIAGDPPETLPEGHHWCDSCGGDGLEYQEDHEGEQPCDQDDCAEHPKPTVPAVLYATFGSNPDEPLSVGTTLEYARTCAATYARNGGQPIRIVAFEAGAVVEVVNPEPSDSGRDLT